MQWTIPSKIQYTNVLTEFPLVLIVKGPWPGGGGGDSHMKQTRIPIYSFKGVNFGFWSRLGCSAQSANIYATKVSFIVPRRNTELCEEKQNSVFLEI